MALTVITILQYFNKDELKDALFDISEPLSGTRAELAKRVHKEWPEHNRTIYDLLYFLPKPVLSDICYHYNLEYRGNKETLRKRIANAVEKNNSSKNQQVESKNFPEEITRTAIQNKNWSLKAKLTLVFSVIIAIGVITGAVANLTTIVDYFERHFFNTKDNNVEQKPDDSQDPYKMAELEHLNSGFELNLEYTVNSPNVRNGFGGVLYDAFVANRGNDPTEVKTFWIVIQECKNGEASNVANSIEKNDTRLLRKADGRQGLQLEIPKIYPDLDKKRTFNLEIRSGGFPHPMVPIDSLIEFKRTYIQFDYNNETGSWNPRINDDFILDCKLEPTRHSSIILNTMDDKKWIGHD